MFHVNLSNQVTEVWGSDCSDQQQPLLTEHLPGWALSASGAGGSDLGLPGTPWSQVTLEWPFQVQESSRVPGAPLDTDSRQKRILWPGRGQLHGPSQCPWG